MDFASALKESTRRPGTACGVGQIRAALTETDRDQLDAAILDGTIAGSAIVRALDALGHKSTLNSVGRHRRRECHCWDAE